MLGMRGVGVEQRATFAEVNMLIIIVILILLIATGPWYPYSRNWGYSPLGIILLILILYLLFGRGRL